MKKIILILYFGTCLLFVQAQCTFENIFPVDLGISKFKATTSIASLRNIMEDKETNKYSDLFNKWEKPDYLKGDSVFKASLFYDYIYHDCFKGDNNKLYLRFVDDKLYTIEIKITFSSNEYEKCLENYNSLIAIFKDSFTDWSEFVKSNSETNEQNGEGYWFYPTIPNKRDTVKINELSIGYEIEYASQWDNYKKIWYKTGNIEDYLLEIEYINLEGTKLTNKGY
jgi:hypothetical protein